MASTSDDLVDRIRTYYDATTTQSYLANWSPDALSMHLGRDGEGVTSHEDAFRHANRFLADLLAVGPATRALDIGCGVGGTAIWVAADRGAHVTGVNIVPLHIELAGKFAAERRVAERTRFVEADALASGLPEGSFDVAWSFESACHVEDARALFAHVRSLLAPGGRYAIVDYFRGTSGDARHVDTLCAGWALPGLRTIAETVTAVESAGFTVTSAVVDTSAVLNSALVMRNMAARRLTQIAFERVLTGATDPVYERHTTASIACTDGMLDGAIEYGVIVASRGD
jgi:tocopherol O-methyltransferase